MAKGQNGTRSIAVRPSQAERRVGKIFADIAKVVSRETGRPWVFALAVGTVIVWAVTGPIFNFSDAWQLVINTGTTIVTFLMVFLIQNSQNRDSAAIQIKLDELIRVSEAHNSFVGLERLTGEELQELSQKCAVRALQEIDAVRTRRAARKQ